MLNITVIPGSLPVSRLRLPDGHAPKYQMECRSQVSLLKNLIQYVWQRDIRACCGCAFSNSLHQASWHAARHHQFSEERQEVNHCGGGEETEKNV